ncbi:Ubiquinol-cytochrome-c reductase complex assembly factor 1 [Bagarius yarrelli]|uniref:Ubiquinol-cytochrome-c reductase complex assembly factor 1 n=1 Tax=Bagarius yarrelli TaxID=175774 RepID=A0A556V883_BAGYA|nr:Ubiquinol-cytochrome-c reductase complex assembly factor 1 [Bagarius yarrelli]
MVSPHKGVSSEAQHLDCALTGGLLGERDGPQTCLFIWRAPIHEATEQDLAKTLVSCHCRAGAVLPARIQCRALHSTQEKIKIAALRMYTCCVERINYDDFFERCSLPDTLNSWFLVAQLHVWMCLVRMRQEGREGKYMCRYIVHSMWEDVEQRSKIMGIDAFQRKESMRVMTETFYAAIFGFDEGILSDDCVLAAALWRNLFNKQCEDPQQLELMVEYVRKQMQFIDALDGDDLLLTGEIKWRPLLEENAQSILKVPKPTYNDAGL